MLNLAEDPSLDDIEPPSSDTSFQPSDADDDEAAAPNAHPSADIAAEPSEPDTDDAEPNKPRTVLPFGFERPFGQPAHEYSRTYTLKDLRKHLAIDERIQALIMEDIESYMSYGPRADPAESWQQYIIWNECASEPRAAVCNDLSQLGFAMEIVRAVFDGQGAKGHSNRDTGFFLYQHYASVKKRVGQRRKRRRSGGAEKAVSEEEEMVQRIVARVVARTAPEVEELGRRVAGHDEMFEASERQMVRNEKEIKKQGRRIKKQGAQLATLQGRLAAIQSTGEVSARGIEQIMGMLKAKV